MNEKEKIRNVVNAMAGLSSAIEDLKDVPINMRLHDMIRDTHKIGNEMAMNLIVELED